MLNLSELPFLDIDQAVDFEPENFSSPGIIGIHGNLSPGVLLSAYSQGVFPWYDDESPILWWSPDPRFILEPECLHVSSSMRKTLRKRNFSVTLDRAFSEVIHACATVPRNGQDGTWIVPEMEEAYGRLHELGFAHSVEVWHGENLVGGLYGISLGKLFFGESMFSLRSNASKIAFILLARGLQEKGFPMIDCQVFTEHLEKLGAYEIDREDFLERLEEGLAFPTSRGKWTGWLNLEDVVERQFR